MQRAEREFLTGFGRAAMLAEGLVACPPSYASAVEYLQHVAALFSGAQDLVGQGVAAGCLAAVGKA